MAEEEPVADESTIDELMAAMRQIEVGQFLLSTVSTMASLAYGKLESGETGQAKIAIDAIQALLPVLDGQVEAGLLRDFQSALANLKVAYADAVGPAE